LTCHDGIRLEAWRHPAAGPRVILIHGWLGSADSSYIKVAAADLLSRGFEVVRLNMRDHGNTSHLNPKMFNSARLQEVAEACEQLTRSPTALVGFSLGGNFALRVCAELGLPALAICPAVDPAVTCRAIDAGLAIYRLYFLHKWFTALAAKQSAFPDAYDFKSARNHQTVLGLTEHFIGNHLPFASSQIYFDAYRLQADKLRSAPAEIIAARDDPVIPIATFTPLLDALPVQITDHGGHCGYLPRTWLQAQIHGFLLRRL
jgi:predicted alpha/beta-fold hydrolase